MNKVKRSLEASAHKGNLVGHYFHSLDEADQVQWQGVVLAQPRRGWYLVQLFEWFMGEPSVRKLIPFEQMTKWFFYETNDEMLFSAEHGTARVGGPYRKEGARSNGQVVETA